MLTTLHFQRVPSWANEVLRDWRVGWAKVVNPAAGTTFPDVPRLCVRHWTDDRDAGYIMRGREGGAAFVRDMLPEWTKTQAACYELANEPNCNDPLALAALNNYTLGALQEADRHGIKLCILNCSEANPSGEPNEIAWKWAQLKDAIVYAVNNGHWTGWHAYWRPGVEGPTGRYHALGRRQYDIEVLRGLGVDVSRLMVLINEAGIDGGIAGGPAQQGWRNLTSADSYRAELVEMERVARTIPQIQACMVFTAGYEEPWGGFDIDESFARSCTDGLRAVAESGGYVAPQPVAPEPPVTPPPLDAAFLAEARAHKVPQNPDAALYKAIRAAGQEIQGDEWAARDTVWQWGYDKGALTWHLWGWTPQRGAWCEYSEEVTR